MLAFLAKLLAGPLITKVLGIVSAYQAGKADEAKLRSEIEKAILDTFAEVSKSQASVIEKEMSGEGWMQRNWRPMVALGFAFIVFFYGLLTPVMVSWVGLPPVRVGDDLLKWIMDAVVICLGGYIGGRSLEKIVTTIVRR